MTVLCVCAVRDSAMNAFARPFFVPSAGVAVRSFQDEVNRVAPDNPMNAHPDDFELFEIGSYDEERGLMIPAEHKQLARAKDFKA